MYDEFREIAEEAKASGLAVVLWCYPRGSGLSKEGETAIDVISYAAQIAAQLGAHVIKVKPPTDHIEQDAARKVYEEEVHRHLYSSGPYRARRAECLQRAPNRHLLGRGRQGNRRRAGRSPRNRPGRRLRFHHGAQFVPAVQVRRNRPSANRHGNLPGRRLSPPPAGIRRPPGLHGLPGGPDLKPCAHPHGP